MAFFDEDTRFRGSFEGGFLQRSASKSRLQNGIFSSKTRDSGAHMKAFCNEVPQISSSRWYFIGDKTQL